MIGLIICKIIRILTFEQNLSLPLLPNLKIYDMKKFFLPIISIAFLASCNLYKNYERPEVIDETVSGIYRDTTAMGGVLAEADTTNFGNMPWREVFTDAKLQVLIEKSLQNFDMQKADMNIEKAKSGLSVAKLAYIPSLVFAPSGTIKIWVPCRRIVQCPNVN